MSFLTGTNTELIYASTTATAALAVTTITHINPSSSLMGVQAHIPPDFWLPNNTSVGRGIRIVARGICSTTTTTPSYTWTISGGAVANTGAPVLLGSAAIPMVASTTNAFWELEGDVIFKSFGAAGANSSLTGTGKITCGAFTSANTAGGIQQPVWGASASPGTVAVFDPSVTNYINVSLTSTAANTANTVTLQQLLVFGLN